MPSQTRPSPQLLILGCGQLAQMMVEASVNLRGMRTRVLAKSDASPAALITPDFTVGQVDAANAGKLASVLAQTEVALFENEFLDVALLETAARDTAVRFFPTLASIALFQDKLSQKRLFDALSLPSPQYRVLESGLASEVALGERLRAIAEELGDDLVLKWSRQGYDGKGVLRVKANETALAWQFVEKARNHGSEVYVEEAISFECELALLSVNLGPAEKLTHLPLVMSVQKAGICYKVAGPLEHLGLPAELEVQARELAVRLAAHPVAPEGAFAIEFFYSAGKGLLINEVAPRVHNSGHFSQDVGSVSQFAAHLLAATGQKIPTSDQPYPPFLMLNLLGPEGLQKRIENFNWPEGTGSDSELRWRFHWYGKNDIVPRRKLGHINIVALRGSVPHERFQEKARELERKWIEKLE